MNATNFTYRSYQGKEQVSAHGNFESCKDVLPFAWWLNKRQVVQCVCGNFYVCQQMTIGYRWSLIEMKGKK